MSSRRPMARSFSANGRPHGDNGESVLAPPVRADSRNYLLNVRPENRSTLCSVMAHLTEETQPFFETTLKSRAVSEFCNAKFVCVVSGHPVPELTWYKDDIELDRYCGLPKYEIFQKGHTHSLHIYDCTEDDAAIYQASARNSKGIVSCSGVLEVGAMNEYKIHQRFFAKIKQKAETKKKEIEESRRRGKVNAPALAELLTASPERPPRKRRSPGQGESGPLSAPHKEVGKPKPGTDQPVTVANAAATTANVDKRATHGPCGPAKKQEKKEAEVIAAKPPMKEHLAKKKIKISTRGGSLDASTSGAAKDRVEDGISLAQYLAESLESQVTKPEPSCQPSEKAMDIDPVIVTATNEKDKAENHEVKGKSQEPPNGQSPLSSVFFSLRDILFGGKHKKGDKGSREKESVQVFVDGQTEESSLMEIDGSSVTSEAHTTDLPSKKVLHQEALESPIKSDTVSQGPSPVAFQFDTPTVDLVKPPGREPVKEWVADDHMQTGGNEAPALHDVLDVRQMTQVSAKEGASPRATDSQNVQGPQGASSEQTVGTQLTADGRRPQLITDVGKSGAGYSTDILEGKISSVIIPSPADATVEVMQEKRNVSESAEQSKDRNLTSKVRMTPELQKIEVLVKTVPQNEIITYNTPESVNVVLLDVPQSEEASESLSEKKAAESVLTVTDISLQEKSLIVPKADTLESSDCTQKITSDFKEPDLHIPDDHASEFRFAKSSNSSEVCTTKKDRHILQPQEVQDQDAGLKPESSSTTTDNFSVPVINVYAEDVPNEIGYESYLNKPSIVITPEIESNAKTSLSAPPSITPVESTQNHGQFTEATVEETKPENEKTSSLSFEDNKMITLPCEIQKVVNVETEDSSELVDDAGLHVSLTKEEREKIQSVPEPNVNSTDLSQKDKMSGNAVTSPDTALLSPASLRRFGLRTSPGSETPGLHGIRVDGVESEKESLLVVPFPGSSPKLKRRESLTLIPSATPEELASGARRKIFIPKTREGSDDVQENKEDPTTRRKASQDLEAPYVSPSLARKTSSMLQPGQQTPPTEKRSPRVNRKKSNLEVPKRAEQTSEEVETVKEDAKPAEKEKLNPFKAPQVIRKIRGELLSDALGHLKLWCQFFNVLSDSTIKWYRDEVEIVEINRSAGDESQVALAIVQTSSRDCGVYGCSIKNEYGTDSTDYLLSADILSQFFLREDLEVGEEVEMTPMVFAKGLAEPGGWGQKFFGRIMTEETNVGEGCARKATRVKAIYGLEPVFESGSTCILKTRNPIDFGTQEENSLAQRNLDMAKQDCRVQNMIREYCKIFAAETRVIENFGPTLEILPLYLMYRPANAIPYASVEADLKGTFLRYCCREPTGRLTMKNGTEAEQKCSTFQHWILQWTNGNLMVTRIEGVDLRVTNIGTATKSKGYQGLPDPASPQVFEQFCMQHQCNYFCGLLGLRPLKDFLYQPGKPKASRSPLLNRKVGGSSSPQLPKKGAQSPGATRKTTSSPKVARKGDSGEGRTAAKQQTLEVPKDIL